MAILAASHFRSAMAEEVGLNYTFPTTTASSFDHYNRFLQYQKVLLEVLPVDLTLLFLLILFTRHSLVRAKGEVFVLLYVCLFGQRFLSNLRADSRHILHAGVAWVGTCQCLPTCPLPLWDPSAPGGRGEGELKTQKIGGGLIRAADSYHFYFSQRCQM